MSQTAYKTQIAADAAKMKVELNSFIGLTKGYAEEQEFQRFSLIIEDMLRVYLKNDTVLKSDMRDPNVATAYKMISFFNQAGRAGEMVSNTFKI